MLEIFVAGHLLATLLALRGETVLHVSAVDGRTVWSPPVTTFDTCRLAAIILPQPDRQRHELDLRPITPGQRSWS